MFHFYRNFIVESYSGGRGATIRYRQFAYENEGTNQMYARTKDVGGWTAWQELATMDKVVPVDNVDKYAIHKTPSLDTAEALYVANSSRTGEDTLQLHFTKNGSMYDLYFGRTGIVYEINGIQIWLK